MSRVGKAAIKIQPGVKVAQAGTTVKVEGPKGKLEFLLPLGISVKVEKDEVHVQRDEKTTVRGGLKNLHGCSRAVIQNMVTGVHSGFKKNLEIVGVGYRAAVQGTQLSLTVGYSHPVVFNLPKTVECKVNKNTEIELSCADRVLLGEVAAKIRAVRPPEPYQGKGIKYAGEVIQRKQGKAAGAK